MVALLLLFGVMYFLQDQVGYRFGIVGALLWVTIFLIIFGLGVAFHALFILPPSIDNWYTEGITLLWNHFQGNVARSRAPKEYDGVPPSIETLGAGVVDSHVVLALGRGGNFSRCAGPGYVKLEASEHIRHVIDLRPHFRQRRVRAVTRDGIPFETTVSATFRVRRLAEGDHPENVPYPFDPTAIFQVSYFSSVGEGGGEIPWTDHVAPMVADAFVGELSNYTLDEVYNIEHIDGSSTVIKPERINKNVHQVVQDRLTPHGIEVASVGLGDLTLPVDVTAQRIANLQAAWQRQAQIQKTKDEVIAMQQLEEAKATAEVELIKQIVDTIEHLKLTGNTDISDIITLVTMESLESAATSEQLGLQPQLLQTLSQVQARVAQGQKALPPPDSPKKRDAPPPSDLSI